MKEVLIIAHFCGSLFDNGRNRFDYLAQLLHKSGFDVELVTSKFCHERKRVRNETIERDYKLTFVHEPPYTKNISLKRIYSHRVFGKNLEKYLSKRKKPDIIYCAVPSLDCSYAAAKYAKSNNIEFVIDVQDIWPEVFEMAFNPPIIGKIIYAPMYKKANYIYEGGGADSRCLSNLRTACLVCKQ
ncbi:MAG: hypothetical protein LBE55_06190 [Clostridiales bacterium]|jgi:hypothetical protein|nr:hypothetical protein [Clostridiales bacterium]